MSPSPGSNPFASSGQLPGKEEACRASRLLAGGRGQQVSRTALSLPRVNPAGGGRSWLGSPWCVSLSCPGPTLTPMPQSDHRGGWRVEEACWVVVPRLQASCTQGQTSQESVLLLSAASLPMARSRWLSPGDQRIQGMS
jgi:hypothetical protein